MEFQAVTGSETSASHQAAAAAVDAGTHPLLRSHRDSNRFHPLGNYRFCTSKNYLQSVRAYCGKNTSNILWPLTVDFNSRWRHQSGCSFGSSTAKLEQLLQQLDQRTHDQLLKQKISELARSMDASWCKCDSDLVPFPTAQQPKGLSFFASRQAEDVINAESNVHWHAFPLRSFCPAVGSAAARAASGVTVPAIAASSAASPAPAASAAPAASLFHLQQDTHRQKAWHFMLDVLYDVPEKDVRAHLESLQSTLPLLRAAAEYRDPSAPSSPDSTPVRSHCPSPQLQNELLALQNFLAARERHGLWSLECIASLAAIARQLQTQGDSSKVLRDCSLSDRCLVTVALAHRIVDLREVVVEHERSLAALVAGDSPENEFDSEESLNMTLDTLQEHIMHVQRSIRAVAPSIAQLQAAGFPYVLNGFLRMPHLQLAIPATMTLSEETPSPETEIPASTQAHAHSGTVAVKHFIERFATDTDKSESQSAISTIVQAGNTSSLLESDEFMGIDFIEGWLPERTAQPSPSNNPSMLSTPASEASAYMSPSFSRATTVSASAASASPGSSLMDTSASSGAQSRPGGCTVASDRERAESWKLQVEVKRRLKALQLSSNTEARPQSPAASPHAAATPALSLDSWRCVTLDSGKRSSEETALIYQLEQHVSNHAHAKACPLINSNAPGHAVPQGFGLQRIEHENRLVIQLSSLSWDSAAKLRDASDPCAIDTAVKRDGQPEEVIVQAIIKKSTQSGTYAVLAYCNSMRFILIHSLWMTFSGGAGESRLNRETYCIKDKGKKIATPELTHAWNAALVHCAAAAAATSEKERARSRR